MNTIEVQIGEQTVQVPETLRDTVTNMQDEGYRVALFENLGNFLPDEVQSIIQINTIIESELEALRGERAHQ